jgi:hypothetical protein
LKHSDNLGKVIFPPLKTQTIFSPFSYLNFLNKTAAKVDAPAPSTTHFAL